VALIVVPFDVVKVTRFLPWQLVEFLKIVQRFVINAAQVAFEVDVVNWVKTQKRCEHTPVSVVDLRTGNVALANTLPSSREHQMVPSPLPHKPAG